MNPKRCRLTTNDKKIRDYTKVIQYCLEVMEDPKRKHESNAKEVSELIAAAIIGISRQVMTNDDLIIKVRDVILNDNDNG